MTDRVDRAAFTRASVDLTVSGLDAAAGANPNGNGELGEAHEGCAQSSPSGPAALRRPPAPATEVLTEVLEAGQHQPAKPANLVRPAKPGRPPGRAWTPDQHPPGMPQFRLPQAPALICDRSGVVQQANTELAELAGLGSAAELVGARVHRFVLGSDDDAALAWPGGGPITRVRVVRCPLAPAPDGTELMMVLLVDVSDLQRAVHALAEERRRVAEVERVAGIGSWEYDPRTGETVWSEGHYTLLGMEPGSVVPGANAMLDVCHPDDREMVSAYWQEHLTTGGDTIDINYRVRWPSGEMRQVNGMARAQRDRTGRLVRFTGTIKDITERWRAETALAEERARLLEAQRISRLGSWSYHVATGRHDFSEALVEMAGQIGVDLNRADSDPIDVVHPDDRVRLHQLADLLSAGWPEETVEFEFRAVPPATNIYACRVRAERDGAGQVVRLHGIAQDVTKQRAMERQLRDERRRLADAQRVASIGTWEWNPASDQEIWSEMLHELFGVPAGEPVTYQTFLALVHPDDLAWVHELWQGVVADRQPVECEHRIVLRDGRQRVIRANGAALTNPNGELIVVGTAQDVTEHRAAEARMRRSSKRFTDLVANTPVGIGLFAADNQLVDANDALCNLLGYTLDQLRNMCTTQLTHPDDELGELPELTRIPAGQDCYTVPQVVLQRSDGEAVYCELHISVSVQDDGQQFWLVVFSDITERRRAAEVLRYQATHDDLTGLPNRAAIKQLLGELLAGPTRSLVAVLLCDIDNFKRVNDSLGHDAGDELLVALANRLADGVPDSCTVARLSGDEYVVICPDTEAAGGRDTLVSTVSELLRAAIPLRGQIVKVSATVGAAVPNGSRAGADDLLRFADAAMYQAKNAGRGRVGLANAALMASADHQVALEGQLRDALATDELVLHFQPVVGPDGTVLTAEALVRWPHPERGMLAPDVFLPVAEQGDLLRELDRWVLRTALREAAQWPVFDGPGTAVAVNLAGLVPGVPDFVELVTAAVQDSGIAWDRVVLELVETALVDLPSRSRAAMAELVDRGVRFAVDDFGTGYSSLARLRELPAQIVKVDRQFVSGVGTNPSDFAVARAVVDMARAMGRSCVAEGVETSTQFHVLRGLGVDAYQGWLFSRPVPPPEFRAVLTLGPLHVPRAG